VTRWLMEMPDGPQLVKNLLTSDPAQMESNLRMHQRGHSLPADGFAAYLPWRQKTLDDLKQAMAGKGGPVVVDEIEKE